MILQNVVQSSSGLSLYKAEVEYGDGDSDTFYSTYQSDDTLKLGNFSHRYYPFNNETYSDGSIKFYYENGGIVTINLEVYKLIDDFSQLNLKTINGQKTNTDNFTFNLVDKNNTLYNYISIDSNQTYTLSGNYEYEIPNDSTLSLLLSTQNVDDDTVVPFTVNGAEKVDSTTGNFIINNNIATADISGLSASTNNNFNITLDYLGVCKSFYIPV